MSNEYDAAVNELMSKANEPPEERPPRRTGITIWAKILVLGIVLIALASGVLAAVVLFNQTPTYNILPALKEGCPAPTGTANGTLITFTCSPGYALNVPSAATGFVRYTPFTVPGTVTDVYLIDTAAKSATTCPLWTSTGATNIPLATAGGQITIGTAAGQLAPAHSYEYCTDYSTSPGNFTFSITWSQG